MSISDFRTHNSFLYVFQMEKRAEEKTHLYYFSSVSSDFVFSEIISKRLSDLEIYKMSLISCPIQFSQERMLKTLPMLVISISDLWSHLSKAVLKEIGRE